MKSHIKDHVRIVFPVILIAIVVLAACSTNKKSRNTKIEDVAGNPEVAKFMKTFEGLGALSDNSLPTLPQDALAGFETASDLQIDLVLAEPSITQPVFLNFDHRGRLWVAQYNQYPYPQGLKVLSMDQYLRAKFDKVPQAPPGGMKGADKISFFEDTDGDGKFDKSTDAITGLNIATSVTLGLGKIWVLDPPYLLAYPDPDGNGLPNGAPEVHLQGFGIEDTHAVANSLRWGPDGWLYGAQGSTCTADISSSKTKNVRFNGQAIWRYNPVSHVFEVYAEGGGNTFYVEIDEKGRFYSGHNGTDRGQYYKQGGYYIKNPDKHGAHTNPYSFGILNNMVLTGDKSRFTHAFIKYDGGSLPERYNGRMIALNPLQNYVQLTRFEPNGSTFKNIDEERILKTKDKWFRPVDIKTGPDGAIYLADWYDSRLSHVDPRDTWHKSSGRIYRLRNKNNTVPLAKFDLSTYTNEQLIGLLSHPNKWFRQQALQQFANRKDKTVIPKLAALLEFGSGQVALEALWAINLSGGFNDLLAVNALKHSDPFVRMWAVRLSGDDNNVSTVVSRQLIELAGSESHPEVRSQLAATAKRLSAANAISITKGLIKNHDDSADPDIPQQIWWAIESKAESDRADVLSMFEDEKIWQSPTVLKVVLKSLMQRYIMAGGSQNYSSAARLLKMAPSEKEGKLLLSGLQDGLKGKESITLPPDLLKALEPYEAAFREESLALALRQGNEEALQKALAIIADNKTKISERLSYIVILGETNQPKSVPALLTVVENSQYPDQLRQAALQALQRYEMADIGQRIITAYPAKLKPNVNVRAAVFALFASRLIWARQLLDAIEKGNEISKDEVPQQVIQQIKLLNDADIRKTTDRLWPEIRLATTSDKNSRIIQIAQLLKSGTGNSNAGRALYINRCGACHRLFNEGGNIGPELTGYDRKNVNDLLTNILDPNAYVREGYVVNHITTADGRTLVGTIKARSGGNITIETFSGERITLNVNQIKEMQEQKASLMPERLLDGMADEEIRNLLAYLMKYD